MNSPPPARTKGAAIPTIIRNGDRKQYAVIDHRTTEDARLTARALGLLAYLLGKPNNWQVQPSDLARRFGVGRDYIYAGLKELREAGYAARQPIREGNRIVRWEMVIYESHNPALLPDNPDVEDGREDGAALLPDNPELERRVQDPPLPDPPLPDPEIPAVTKDRTQPSLEITQTGLHLHASPTTEDPKTEAPPPHPIALSGSVASEEEPPPTDLATRLERMKRAHDSQASARAADRLRREQAQSVSPPGVNPRRIVGGQR